eukprot:2047521-Rhodomonas_salina.4
MDAILPSPKGLPSVSNSAGVYAWSYHTHSQYRTWRSARVGRYENRSTRRVTSPVKAPTAGAAPGSTTRLCQYCASHTVLPQHE